MRRRVRSGSRDAATAVGEAALVASLLIVVTVGVVEMALLMRDTVALTSLADQGARTAAAELTLPATGPASPSAYCVGVCHRTEGPGIAGEIATAVARDHRLRSRLEELWLYRADASGRPAGNSAAAPFQTCGSDCLAYRWEPEAGRFALVHGDWDPEELVGCRSGRADRLGVYVTASHRFATWLLPASSTITEHNVVRLDAACDRHP